MHCAYALRVERLAKYTVNSIAKHGSRGSFPRPFRSGVRPEYTVYFCNADDYTGAAAVHGVHGI